MVNRSQEVSTDAEQILHDTVNRREALELSGRLETPHLALTLAGRLVGDLRAVVRVLIGALSHLATRADKPSMQTTRSIYRGFCFPPEIIAHAVFLYHRFPLSLRDVEDLLAQRGIAVSYETIRRWCRRFGPHYARNVRRQRPTAGDHWLLDEVFLQIQGRRQYLWRAIDQDGDILDILMQRRRNGRAATRFVRKLLKQQQRSPNRVVTDKLGSYRIAHRAEIASVPHDTTQYANNRIEASHRRTRVRERQMLRFRSAGNAQRFLSVQASILNLFSGRVIGAAISYAPGSIATFEPERSTRGRWQFMDKQQDTSSNMPVPLLDVTEPCDGRHPTGQDGEHIWPRPAVARAGSDDHVGEAARPAPLEASVRVPSSRPGGERVLPLQVHHRRWPSRPEPSWAGE